MKLVSVLPVALLILTICPAPAEDIETLDHHAYKGTITRAEPDGIMFTTDTGIIKIPFDNLPPEYRKRFQYDADGAKAFAAADAEKQRQLYLQTQEHRRIASENDAKISAAGAAEVDAFQKKKAITSFVLDANEVGTMDTSSDIWKTDWGSYDRQIAQEKRIAIAVHDVRRSSARCLIDVYFVAKSMTKDLHFVYAHQSIPLDIQNGMEVKTLVTAPQLDSRVLNLAALGTQYAEGAQMEGWIVTAKIGGQQFGSSASNQVVGNDAGGLIAEFEAREKAASEKKN